MNFKPIDTTQGNSLNASNIRVYLLKTVFVFAWCFLRYYLKMCFHFIVKIMFNFSIRIVQCCFII